MPVPVPLQAEWPDWPDGVVTMFTTHRTEMVRLAHVITGSNAIAEDLVQEAFLRLLQRWPSLDENPTGYLRTMVVNAAREHLRRLEVERRHAPALQADREARRAEFATGLRCSFAADTSDDRYVAFVEANLANDNVGHGEANLSYSTHPAHWRPGHATRAVSLLVRFLRDHIATRVGHILIDADNAPSLGVARAVGAVKIDRHATNDGHTMINHTLPIR